MGNVPASYLTGAMLNRSNLGAGRTMNGVRIFRCALEFPSFAEFYSIKDLVPISLPLHASG